MISELLKRSGECPMIFLGQGMFDSIDATEIALIVANIHRFRHFSLSIKSDVIHDVPPFSAAPQLEVFHLRLHNWGHAPHVFPLLLSKSDFPRIQDVELRRLPFNNYGPFLRSTLTKLSLTWCSLEDRDCNAFLSSLQEMRGLRELLLSSLEVPRFDIYQVPENFHLPTLRRLTIVANNDSSIMRILARITVPHSTYMHFHFRYTPPRLQLRWSEFEQFIREVKNFLISNVVGGVPTLRSVRLQSGGGVALFGWNEELPNESRLGMRDEEPDFNLLVRMSGPMDSQALSLRLLCESLPLSEARIGFIVIQRKVLPLSSVWHSLLNAMTDIRHLQLSIPNPVYFCRALSKRSGAHPTLLLPKLERLALYHTQFLPSQHPLRCTPFQQIVSWLRLRAGRGYKISTLEFREAVNFQEGDLDVLRDCADEVIWDNKEKILHDPSPHSIPTALSMDDLEPHLLMDQARTYEAGQ
ncbi:hypothetical protein NLI96_g7657 [Meripilus lineatus]|uniref:Uncharacterized protein n=1 Tax=Meripilus lineatus TaxID=2056292 RepID=A0AAD5YCR3_9APHY|nr:hypothetical protein NLI96_g7657 [Physisporinus lineatus]